MQDPGSYCREVEAYLCRKNDGHLIRIVGPAFEKVCGWAERGIPLKIAFQGIDRYFERYYAKGPRRRPVRVEFCEADVLDAFDAWRRAVGVAPMGGVAAPVAISQPSLPSHLERVSQKLTSARIAASDERLVQALDAAIDGIGELRGQARTARGDARARLIGRLKIIDDALIAAARDLVDDGLISAVRREAEDELAGFAPRMSREAYQRAAASARDRLLRLRLSLPRVTYDE
jgi:hypothetical protein